MLNTARSVQVSARFALDEEPQRSVLGGIWKRTFDVAIGAIAVVVLTPIMIATAGLVRVLLGRPVIVTEERIGYKGRPFAHYAFRTVSVTTEEFIDQNRHCRQNTNTWQADVLGQTLRFSGLEKLPELFNVVRGDMSLVGPRPITAKEFLRYRVHLPAYFNARPGLTGIWRHVDRRRLRAAPTWRLAIDRHYVRCWSIQLDLLLLVKAIFANQSESDIA